MRYFLFILLVFLNVSCKREDLHWVMINVDSTGKQGDAHLIIKGDKAFMIDTGQHYYSQKTLLPYLKKRHITHLNGIILTHPHFDHYGGIVSLIESNITIDAIYMNMPTKEQMQREPGGGLYRHLIQIRDTAYRHHIPIATMKRGDKFQLGKDSYIEVLYIFDGIHTPVGATDINGMSLIAMLHNGKNRVLFTGDMSQKIGKWLAKNAKDLKAEVLKFPHHGTEEFAPNDFFDAVDPKVVLIPSPKGLWCSKRSQRARDLVQKHSYKAYINGFHGHIEYISDGNSYKIIPEHNVSVDCK